MLQKSPDPGAREGGRFLPSRRGFLIGTGAALGVGIGFLLWPRHWPEPELGERDDILLNAWVRVSPGGVVTVALPQAEMGQGAWSGLAQILADEMGADWQQVAVEPSPFHPAYAHVGLVKEGTASLPPVLKDMAAFAGATAIRRLNLQMTGGSTSVKGYHDILREAGAVARALLVGSAARAWQVNRDAIDARDGVLRFQANRMRFEEAVKGIDPDDARHARLREEGHRPLVGQSLPRIDLPPKVDGTARFGADVRVPGMVFAAIRHGPAGNGRLVEVKGPAGQRVVKGANWVATTGETNFEARKALSALEPTFETDGEPAGDWIEAQLASLVATGEGKAVHSFGKVDDLLGGEPLTADYQVPFLAHACMEPMVATARLADGKVELWGPTQSRTLATMAVARALGVDAKDILIHPTLLGGGFGRKAEADHFVEAALIAQATGKPVQLQWSREEDLHADMFRPAGAARLKGRVGPDGRIAAFDVKIAIPSVGFSFMNRNVPFLAPGSDKPNASAIEGADRIPYAVESFRAIHAPLEIPVPLGFWRSVGHSFSAFFIESFMDELATAAGVDPVAFRLRHLADQPRHAAVLKAVAADARFADPPANGFAKGVAIHESFGSIVGMVVEAGVQEGAVIVRNVWAAVDCGRAINPDSVRAQIEGAAIQGLDAALRSEISFEDGMAVQRNFDTYPLMTLAEAPAVFTRIIESGASLGGIGEPGLPPAAPALANALASATGIRARALPLGASFA